MGQNKKYKILFFCEAVTFAHTIRPLKLALGLDSDKYEIVFASDIKRTKFVLDKGFKVINIYSQSHKEFSDELYYGTPLYSKKLIERYIEEDMRILDEVQPDIVVGDFRLSLGISARLKKIPYATIANFHWSIYSHEKPIMPYGFLQEKFGYNISSIGFKFVGNFFLKMNCLPYKRMCRKYKLKEPKNIYQMYCDADYVLYEDSYNISRYVDGKINNKHRFLGPILWEPPVLLPEELKEKDNKKIRVYLSMGSSGIIFEKIVNVLSDDKYEVFMSTAQEKSDIEYPKNFHVYDYLPALKVLEHVDIAIVNAGMARYQAVSRGVPVLMFPFNMDQFMGAEYFKQKHLGLYLRHNNTNEEEIKRSINELLNDNRIRINVKVMEEKLRKEDAQKNFNKFLDELFN